MNTTLYLAFIATSAALIAIPGPNVLLIVSTSLARGAGAGLRTVAGTSTAMAIQLAVAAGGLASLMVLLSEWFALARWAGVAYLAWLGIKAWREAGYEGAGAPADPRAAAAEFAQGFLVSLTNPKTLLFFAAFLPQFVDPAGAPPGLQLAVLAGTFLALAVALDGAYALLASRALRRAAAGPAARRWRGPITGTLYLGASVGLALARRP